MKRDAKDIQTILDYIKDSNPFTHATTDLHSLSSGLIDDSSVNVDSADQIGSDIITSMQGKSVSEFKFLKKHKVTNLSDAVYVTHNGEKVQIQPEQLYQRLIVAGIDSIEIHELLTYELCSYPSSLFDSKLMMRVADKADLKQEIIKSVPTAIVADIPIGCRHVVDGGWLLHLLPWPKTIMYSDLFRLHIDYVLKHFHDPLVVLDGYGNGPSTKDETHLRRSGHETGADVDITPKMIM